MAYIFNVSFEAGSYDTVYLPIPRSTAIQKSGSAEGEPQPSSQETIGKYGLSLARYSVKPGDRLHLQYKQESPLPPKPTIRPEDCLGNDEWFTKWKLDSLVMGCVQDVAARLHNSLRDRDYVEQLAILIKQRVPYKFPRTKYEYVDEILTGLGQDCLGMHGLLCGMLRASGIPAVLDVGFRLDTKDSPHVWLWYWDKEKSSWEMADLNDRDAPQIGNVTLPRISMSLGTTHQIGECTAGFVQYLASDAIMHRQSPNHSITVYSIVG